MAVVPLTLYLGVGGDKVQIFDTKHLDPCLRRCRAGFSTFQDSAQPSAW